MTKSKHLHGLHRKPGEERQEHDFYATSPLAIPPLLDVLGWQHGGKVIRENSCGAGHLCRPLEDAGHVVVASDLIDRGHGITGVNFLEPHWLDSQKYDAVIMNPPYKFALEFVRKSLTLAPVVCAFLRLSWLEGGDTSGRYQFFQDHPPSVVAVFSDRVPSAKNADFESIGNGGTVAYAWYIWNAHAAPADPVIKWLRLPKK